MPQRPALVDVMPVLLPIVLTISTFIIIGGIQVKLSKAESVEQLTELHPHTVGIDKQGQIWRERNGVVSAAPGVALKPPSRETSILGRAGNTPALQSFVDVFAMVKDAGSVHLSLQTGQQP